MPTVQESSGEVTQLLAELNRGNQAALTRLIPLVYGELRRLAEHYLREHARWGGSPPSLEECLEECELLWVEGLSNLGFGLGLARADSDTCEGYRASARRDLLEHLTLLLDRCC